MSARGKLLLGLGALLAAGALVGLLAGAAPRNDGFQPTRDYRLEPWVRLELAGIDLSVTKAVLYLALAAVLTVATMVFAARRAQARPDRTQVAVEAIYLFARDNLTGGNLPAPEARRWFPFITTLFVFLWYSNVIGYIPLPVNTAETVDVLGLALPAFGLYAATANISVTLTLALLVWAAYHVQGVRARGLRGYLASWIPAGTPKRMRPVLFVIELISHFVRIISLSVRLFANILAGHLLLLFMGGGLAVLLGIAALGWLTFPAAFAFFVFEIVIVAGLQAFIFTILTAIYIGGATAESH